VPKVEVELAGVPETALWTLYQRALEARRPDAVLRDPLAVELVERLDYPFAERFGDGRGFSQWQALRAATFDREVRRFAAACPRGTVVALGEGLETGFWRVDNGRVRWLSVELPEMAALRRELLPQAPNLRLIERSALDQAWMDEVDGSRGVLLTAQGLLMYFERDQVYELIDASRRRFAGGGLVFDAIPRWVSERSRRSQLRSPSGYEPPPWLWGIDTRERRALGARRVRAPRGRGVAGSVLLPQLLYVLAIRF
jgi:O-methyltransferase involved in polyketide biosynthesis